MRSPHRALVATLAAAAVVVGATGGVVRTAPSNAIDADLFADLAWRPIGPNRPGVVTAIAASPAATTTWIVGMRDGGLWRTVDAGRTWSVVLDGHSIGAVAMAPSDPNVIYAGTGNASLDAAEGDGLYASTDGGRTWTRAGLADSRAITAVVVDPKDANRVFVAAQGDPYGPGGERGIFRRSTADARSRACSPPDRMRTAWTSCWIQRIRKPSTPRSRTGIAARDRQRSRPVRTRASSRRPTAARPGDRLSLACPRSTPMA
jgi:hypothetical protein